MKMAQTKNKLAQNRVKSKFKMGTYIKEYANLAFLKEILFNPKYLHVTCYGLIFFEIILNIFIIQRIKYTEIDWIAYMQEVEGFLNGTLDYKELRGVTGPLVYPAGFVYLYSILYYITSFGQNIRLAQYVFLLLYICQIYITFEIYCKTKKIPPYALILSTVTSYRIHSIYVLRLFNDPFATFFFYVSLSLFIKNKWILGSFFYSLAVSIKMNILLYAPCLLLAYLTNLSYRDTFLNLTLCALVQLVLGLPFLHGNFWSYLKGSFDLGRVFEHKWTVNYRFLDRGIFESKFFHLGLLMVHVMLLLLFLPAIKKYFTSYYIINSTITDLKSQNKKATKKQSKEKATREEKLTREQEHFLEAFEKQLTRGSKLRNGAKEKPKVEEKARETVEIEFSTVTRLFVLPFFVTNLIGVACARSLHYQFYCWYFHSLLYLVHCTHFRKPVIFLILAIVEFCWNTYPSTDISSGLLHLCHILILYGVYKVMNEK